MLHLDEDAVNAPKVDAIGDESIFKDGKVWGA